MTVVIAMLLILTSTLLSTLSIEMLGERDTSSTCKLAFGHAVRLFLRHICGCVVLGGGRLSSEVASGVCGMVGLLVHVSGRFKDEELV